MGEKSCDQLLLEEEWDLPPYLRSSKVGMSLLMTLFLARGSKEMIVWTLASLVIEIEVDYELYVGYDWLHQSDC